MKQLSWVIAADHAGVALKQELVTFLRSAGHEVNDMGVNDPTLDDNYAEIADWVAKAVAHNNNLLGVLVCGTGIGVSIRANRFKGVRAAVVHNEFLARSARAHNNANILCFGQRVVAPHMAKECLKAFMETNYEAGRHRKRVAAIDAACLNDDTVKTCG